MKTMTNASLKVELLFVFCTQREVDMFTQMTRTSIIMVWQKFTCGISRVRLPIWRLSVHSLFSSSKLHPLM